MRSRTWSTGTIAALFIGGAAKQSFVVRTGIAGLNDVLNKPNTTTSARSKLNEAHRHGEDGENCSMRAFKGQIDDREYVAGLKKDLTSVASVATAGQALPLKCSDTIRSPRATIHQMILTQTPKALYNWQTCGE
jgi:hypothetical protein